MIEQSIDQLTEAGKKPPCAFAFLLLGSLARGEMTAYSDVDCAILLEEPFEELGATGSYFLRFSRLLQLKLFSFGETPISAIEPLREILGEKLFNALQSCCSQKKGLHLDMLSSPLGNLEREEKNKLIGDRNQLLNYYKLKNLDPNKHYKNIYLPRMMATSSLLMCRKEDILKMNGIYGQYIGQIGENRDPDRIAAELQHNIAVQYEPQNEIISKIISSTSNMMFIASIMLF